MFIYSSSSLSSSSSSSTPRNVFGVKSHYAPANNAFHQRRGATKPRPLTQSQARFWKMLMPLLLDHMVRCLHDKFFYFFYTSFFCEFPWHAAESNDILVWNEEWNIWVFCSIFFSFYRVISLMHKLKKIKNKINV